MGETAGAHGGTGQQQAVAPLPTLGMKTFGGVGVDAWGAVLLVSAVGSVALIYLWFTFLKWRAGRGRMNSVAAGQLRLAATRGRVQDLVLLARLPDFQVDADLLGFTPLHAACVQGQAGAAVWLLQRGADVTKLKQDGWRDTALHYAAGSGSMGCVQALLAWGADPTLSNALGSLPADVAAKAGHQSLASYLRSAAAAAAASKAASAVDGDADDAKDVSGTDCVVVVAGVPGGQPDLPGLPSKEELIRRYIMDPFRAARARARQSRADMLASAEAGEAAGPPTAASSTGGSACIGSPAMGTPATGSPAVGSSAAVSPQASANMGPKAAASEAAASRAATALAAKAASTVGVGDAGGRSFTAATPEQEAALRRLVKRGFEGLGTPGTVPKRETRLFRPLAILTQFLGGAYLVWRALRTLRPGYYYFYSIPFWLAEFLAYCMSYCFVTSLFNMIERPERRVREMLPPERVPHVDVLICTYSEPVDIVEPTAVAALNMNWPGTRLTIHILDDSNRPEMARLVRRLTFQCKYMRREATIVYVARQKVKGVPHHAKAGNINSCLLKEGPKQGEFVLVLDCDMIVHPDFLERTVGHFYMQKPEGKLPTSAPSKISEGDAAPRPKRWRASIWPFPAAGNSRKSSENGAWKEAGSKGDSQRLRWVPKAKAAFIQTPQDFWNVDAADPMVHCARFFYGPMLQGRDGIGAAPCCGTGVVFRRDVLVSIGGQAYGSITEDYNSAMTLMSAGMATMYLNERLSFGMAPDHITDVMTQRLRWAMGAIQILMKDNPLRLPGLTVPQSLLFFEAAAHHYLAFSTIFMAIVPIVFLYSQVSPMVCAHLWEFAAVFGAWYLCNRLMMWHLHRGTEGGMQELWRGSQMWVWMAPNHIKAIWKVLVAENPVVKRLFNFEIGFSVTKKDKEKDTQWESFKKALGVTWPHLLYLVAFISGILYFIITAAKGWYSAWQIMIFLSSIAWGMLIVLCIWPAVYTMLPRVETEAGWKIVWDPFEDPAKVRARENSTLGGPMGSRLLSFQSFRGGSFAAGTSAARRLARKSVDFLSSLHIPFPRGAGNASVKPQPQAASSVAEQQTADSPASKAAGAGTPAAPGFAVAAPEGAASTASSEPAAVALRPKNLSTGSAGSHVSPFAVQAARMTTASTDGSTTSLQSTGSVHVSSSSRASASPFVVESQQPLEQVPAPGVPSSLPAHVAITMPGGQINGVAGAGTQAPGLSATAFRTRSQMSQALGSESAYSAAADVHRSRPLSNFGRVGLRSRVDTVLTSSALLTSMVLPERSGATADTVSVLLDSAGNVAPATDPSSATAQGRQASRQLLPGLEGQDRLDSGTSGAQTSVVLDAQQAASLQHLKSLTGANVQPAPPTSVTLGGRRGASAASPFTAGPGATAASPFGTAASPFTPGSGATVASPFAPGAGAAVASPFTPSAGVATVSPFAPGVGVTAASPFTPGAGVAVASPFAPSTGVANASPFAPSVGVGAASPFLAGAAVATASPFAPSAGVATLSVTAGQLPVISEVRLTSQNSLDPQLRRSANLGASQQAPLHSGNLDLRRRSADLRRRSVDQQKRGSLDGPGRGQDYLLRRSMAAWGAGGGDPALPVVEEEHEEDEEAEEGREGPGTGGSFPAGAGPGEEHGGGGGGGSSGGDGSTEDSLVEELAGEAKQEGAAQYAVPDTAPDRVSMLSRQLVDLAASLCPANASMLLDQGYSLAVPVVPTSIYEHTLVARPNFKERESPASNWMFVIVNGALLACLVVGSILDVKMNKAESDVAATIGI